MNDGPKIVLGLSTAYVLQRLVAAPDGLAAWLLVVHVWAWVMLVLVERAHRAKMREMDEEYRARFGKNPPWSRG
jgi:ABC-type microcin C transport system permease subunit YejE